MTKKRIKRWDDGDSGIFTDGIRFRLNRVRAPEHHQFGGETATRRAAGMTGRNKGVVNIKPVAKDKHGRLVVDMRNQDGSINKRLLKRGCRNKGR